ncbi:PAS domain-containing protein [Wolinella succinogenes]|uniref:PUTATIVE SIGNAL-TRANSDUCTION SENSOR PROTEIN n=1 Tax=Wolinella succinogenes (strain ATCC 29543 / DSM 1740 / CCUG 13145 / JCM 31913 / LMG 7466 / NCTC 11488 / FDC 602W) TaxID=273121 RepID=Q7M9T5_WOLSU|nr:PAS domain-containing protein [Wolinella succinogenes]NLU34908.1 PAS domain-containing protein [Wolinella succinogenes]CAE09822.1 PUTATIVE SIGNAL-TRANSDUCTION SENSOR PROTEIN [Wolinella succinogenes]VEG82033.1 Aerotaxis receptor [Wolinella succinogenes]HCZ19439.1 PAS domain S-box protein [Helicobacter sp.]
MKRPAPTQVEKSFKEDEIIVSKTDTKGIITYGNQIFIELSGYAEKELLGKPHSIIRHPDMPRIVFKLLWDTLSEHKEIFAYVKNLSKDGAYYWVLANVTPSFDALGKVIGYHSVRRKPSKEALAAIEPIYKLLLGAEKEGGMEASQKVMEEFLLSKGMSYEEFILSL